MKRAVLLVWLLLAIAAPRGQESQRIGLRLILVKTEAEAAALLARITEGDSFEELARRFSIDPSAPSAGFIGFFDPIELKRELQTALAVTLPGRVSGVVKLNSAFALLYRLTADEAKSLIQQQEAEELARKNRQVTPLHQAVMKGDRVTVERLLAAKADIKAQDLDGWTPLHRAAQRGDAQIASLLLDHGADIEERDAEGFTPIITATESKSVDTVALMIRRKANVNVQTNDGRTALYQAAVIGSIEIAKLLLANGALVDSRDQQGNSPIAVATFGRHVDVMDLLAEGGANVNASDRWGRTPLHLAVAAKDAAATQLLLLRGAQVNSRNANGCTPLNLAAEGSDEVVKLLISAGADVNVGCRHAEMKVEGITPLHSAVNSGNRVVVQVLLEAKASVDARDSLGQQPLMVAFLRGDWAITDLLIQHGAYAQFDLTLTGPQSVAQARSAADRGYPFAQFALGAAYQFGDAGLSRNLAEARAWYTKAATQGHPGASNGLAWMYEYGLGGSADIREAARWYRAAAEKGYAKAQNNLGFILMNYSQVQNYPEAVGWLLKASAQGYADAFHNLGKAHERGVGTTQDYEAAASLYRKSAELGTLPSAAASLAKLYWKGLGVKQDDAQAYAWFLLAMRSAKNPSRSPAEDETDLIRADFETLAKRMTPTQISAAEQWVTQWIQTHPRR